MNKGQVKAVFYSHFRGHSALGSSSVPFRSWISKRSECNVLSSLVEEAEGCGSSSFQRGKPGLHHLAFWCAGQHLGLPEAAWGPAGGIDTTGCRGWNRMSLCHMSYVPGAQDTLKHALSQGQDDENHRILAKEIRVKYLVHGSDDAVCKDVSFPETDTWI